MEVKILCACGAKYKFEVEPANGQLPGPVQCPVCGADGTEAGNRIIAEALAKTAVAPASAPGAVRVSLPTSSRPAGGAGFAAPAIPRSSKELRASAPPASGGPPVPSPAAPTSRGVAGVSAIAVAPPVPSPSGTRLSVAGGHAATAPVEEAGTAMPAASTSEVRTRVDDARPSFAKGIAGAGVAGLIALIAWFFIYTYLSRKLGFIAIVLGAFVGWAAARLGKEKSMRLGVTAALVTIGVMLVGSFWAIHVEQDRVNDEILREMYDEEVAFAKEAVKARTDAEIRAFLAGYYSDDYERVTPEEIEPEEIAEFRQQLPEYRKFAEGRITRVQFERQNRPNLEEFDGIGMIVGLGFSLLWLGLAAASAFKVASGA